LEVVLYGSVQSVQQGKGHKNRGKLAQKSRQFWRVFLVAGGHTVDVHTTDCWHIFQGVVFLGRAYSSTNLAHFSKAEIWGTVLGVVSGFSLAGNCILLLICTFLKLIKSLSLIGFPHIGVFPGIA
jgi:hypothetical protein